MGNDIVTLHRLAEQLAPHARQAERNEALTRLSLQDEHVLCDVPAWGGYLSRGLPNPSRILCLDPNVVMVDCPGAKIIGSGKRTHSLPTGSVDRLVSLVGLHHLSSKQVFVNEHFRVLRSSGVAVLSEVLNSTPVASFLNTEVNRYSPRGHTGTFVEVGGLTTLMTNAGFTSVTEETVNLVWWFANMSQMVGYIKNIFTMVTATDSQVQAALENHFALDVDGSKACIPWPLVYSVGVKP